MKKRCLELEKEFEMMLQERQNDKIHITALEDEILAESQKINEKINKPFFEERLKYINKFKKSTSPVVKGKKWKDILNLRTHSKKLRKRGRKRSKIQSTSSKNAKEGQSIINEKVHSPIKSNNSSLTPNLSEIKTGNLFKNFSKFNYPSAFSSRLNNSNRHISSQMLVTPEKIKGRTTSTLMNRPGEDIKNKTVISFNSIPFASTYDKSKSGRKTKNCFLCKIKPIKIVSDIVDIEDPNMLDKIDNANSSNDLKACICSSPDNKKLCDFCLTISNKKTKQKVSNFELTSNKKMFPNFNSSGGNNIGINIFSSNIRNFNFMDTTPNKGVNNFNTPGYGKYNRFTNYSENKINYAK